MARPTSRSIYLVTYGQADLIKFTTRKSFADVITEAFSNGQAQIKQWVCSIENHKDGGKHYQLAIKLDRNRHWLSIRNDLEKNNEIQVNFSDRHTNYFDAWSYVTKGDTEFLQSENHPDLSSGYIPRTKAATDKKKECGSAYSIRKRSFDAVDLSDVILAKKNKNKSQLLKFVYEQNQEGKRDLKEIS